MARSTKTTPPPLSESCRCYRQRGRSRRPAGKLTSECQHSSARLRLQAFTNVGVLKRKPQAKPLDSGDLFRFPGVLGALLAHDSLMPLATVPTTRSASAAIAAVFYFYEASKMLKGFANIEKIGKKNIYETIKQRKT